MLASRMENLTPYIPGEQPKGQDFIKLNTNENPFPCAPSVKKALESFDPTTLKRYPAPDALNLRKAIAGREGVEPENIIAGNGSDEILSFMFFAFFDSTRGPLLFPEFTYSFYPVYCKFYQIDYKKIPLKNDFFIDFEMYNTQDSCGVIFPNPNAPTGIYQEPTSFLKVVEYNPDRVVVVDEAYIEFGGKSAVTYINDYPNLVIARTFSKSHSMAGMRLGYAIGGRKAIEALETVRDSFNSYPVDTLAQTLGTSAIEASDYYREINSKVISNRELLTSSLRKAGWQVLPSCSNFIFASCPGLSGEQVYNNFRKQGVLVRYFNTPGIENFVRISIGTEEEMTMVADIAAGFVR